MSDQEINLLGTDSGFLKRLAQDRSGNTLAIIGAALIPVMAMVGGGVDMGRSYLAQSRLQQACDAGVLAARKRLGTEAVVSGTISDDVSEMGNRFFNVNFRDGAYGSKDRGFQMELNEDYSITGKAEVVVPTTIMGMFGYDKVPIKVDCRAQINFNNTDVMMVLDVTGSMAETNSGDTMSRMDVLKSTVKDFHTQLEAAASAGTRIRYGFVPYSTNVNVGGLLKDDWVTTSWGYQSRELMMSTPTVEVYTYWTASTPISGTKSTVTTDTYDASFDELKGYYCPTKPANDLKTDYKKVGETSVAVLGPPAGVKITKTYERTRNGDTYSVTLNGMTCEVKKTTWVDYVDTYDEITEPRFGTSAQWRYDRIIKDVSDWRTTSNGCIEERDTYQIDDYDNVDLTRALDLDLDTVPTAGVPSTQWRPMYPNLIYGRAVKWDGSGKFQSNFKITSDEYITPSGLKTTACPPAAQKLKVMDGDEIDAYLATLKPNGSTYHDIGMIWGGRLLSPTGLFASENADTDPSSPSSRHMIFLTDGETSALDVSYSSYGFEPVDQRRWDEKSKLSLNETIEERFSFACKEVRKRNITVWVIGFGVELNPIMKECAGDGHYFEAADAVELNATFATIAKKMSMLRLQS